MIIVPSISAGDTIVISMSNGGMVKLTYDYLILKAEDDEIPFEAPIQHVSLASSLKLTVSLEDTSLGKMMVMMMMMMMIVIMMMMMMVMIEMMLMMMIIIMTVMVIMIITIVVVLLLMLRILVLIKMLIVIIFMIYYR